MDKTRESDFATNQDLLTKADSDSPILVGNPTTVTPTLTASDTEIVNAFWVNYKINENKMEFKRIPEYSVTIAGEQQIGLAGIVDVLNIQVKDSSGNVRIVFLNDCIISTDKLTIKSSANITVGSIIVGNYFTYNLVSTTYDTFVEVFSDNF